MLGRIRRFFRSRRPVVVNCYTHQGFMYEHSQIRPTKEFSPKWLRDIPAKLPIVDDELVEGKTLRLCSGLNQLLDTGYIIPMWADLKVRLGDRSHAQYKWALSDESLGAVIHPPEQRGEYLPDTEYSHLKLDNQWTLHCDEPIRFAMIDNTWMWDKPDDVVIPAGILDFHYQHGLNVNIFFKRGDDDKTVFIPHGQPLAQLIPLTDRKVVFKHHLVTVDEYRKLDSLGGIIKFHGSEYKKRSNKSYCPYSSESGVKK